jgi:membrane protease YdiL (CAAX protease family)
VARRHAGAASAGVWPAVLISSLLFGLAHLANSALRGVSIVIAAQALGAAVQGIGFEVLRLRTHTIWPLIAIHALHDLFLQMSILPIPLVDALIATVTAVYGFALLRTRWADTTVDAVTGRTSLKAT